MVAASGLSVAITAGHLGSMRQLDQSAGSVAPASARRSVRSFDIFDTLIARRCFEPARIFEAVEHRSGFANFAALRRQAEARIAHADYDLDAIYREFGRAGALSRAEAEALKELEIACELEQVIPIAENIAQVRDGDLLISDMYLDKAIIRQLLAKAGFAKDVEMIVSCAGKQSGHIWPKMTEGFAIEKHCGDNKHSDVAMPSRFGIAAREADQSAPTVLEAALIRIGLRDLALLCREARLVSWHENPAIRALQEIQTALNLPLLLLASIRLARLAQSQACEKILFSSRDCNLWFALFQAIAGRLGLECSAEYFYTSRIARTKPSQDYLAYAESRLIPNSIVVDICGTGWSIAHLTGRLGQWGRHNFFLHELPRSNLYETKAPTPETCCNHHVLGPSDPYFDNRYLEMCNYSEEGMVLDVVREAGDFRPVPAPDPRPAIVKLAVAEQRRCFLSALDLLRHHPLELTLALDDQSIAKVCVALYTFLSQQAFLFEVFLQSHNVEDRETMIALLQPV